MCLFKRPTPSTFVSSKEAVFKRTNMNTKAQWLLMVLVFAAFGDRPLMGQTQLQVYPGDVTNNGVVNNLDFLQLGLAYNFAGAARDSASQNFEALPVNPWSFQFPGGLNMAYADCNGDGFVNYYFDAFPLYTHYGLQRDSNVVQDVFVAGLAGVDPSLQFDSSAVPNQVFGGQSLRIPIELGTEDIPVEDFYGIAFSVTLPPAIFDVNQTKFSFSEQSWANPDNDRIWMSKKVGTDRIDVGLVRTDRNQKRGYGRVGYADFVIIVDVIAIQQPYPVVIDQIKMMDKFGNYATVAGDTIWVNTSPNSLLANDNLKQEPQIQVFPNPANDQLNIQSSEKIKRLSMMDMLGQTVLEKQVYSGNTTTLPLPKMTAGMYLLRIETERGIAFRRIQIQP